MAHKIAIVTDSTAYIPDALNRQHNIHVVPQVLVWEQKTYRDGVDIKPADFYQRQLATTTHPTTSQATVKDFKEAFEAAAKQADSILTIVLSSDLSGAYNSAVQAMDGFGPQKIELIDSRMISMALGYLVLAAARLAADGASMADCAQLVRSRIPHAGVIITPITLEYLHRSGRISGTKRLLGTALNVKPILELVDGKLHPSGQVRTTKKAQQHLVETVAAKLQSAKRFRVAAVHANAPENAQEMLALLCEKCQPLEALVADVSPTVGCHTGPGTTGLAWSIED